MKKYYLLVLAVLTTLQFQAQSCGSLMKPISIEERAAEATLIVEAEVISQKSYWDASHGNIYTLHELEIYKIAKGRVVTKIYVETMGGAIDGNFQSTSSSASLTKGSLGIFFLKNSNTIFSNGQQAYKIVAAAQGYIRYNKSDSSATDVFNKYFSVTNDVHQRIEACTHKSMQLIKHRFVNEVSNLVTGAPVIDSFSPSIASAGTGTTITISGSSFGTDLGQVLFPTANDGGTTYTAAKDTQIVTWSDQTIIVKVPFTAGTGNIQVLNVAGTTISTGTLAVPFSHSNATDGTTDFPRTIQSNSGSFTFDYHTDFNTSAAKPYFEQAFGLWNCESGINFVFGTTTSTDVSADDGINIVRFDNGNELPSGVLGQVTTRVSNICNLTGDALAREIDITWNDDFNFYYGDGTPASNQYDFKTVALHELGHAHQLNHIINSNNIMHYNLGLGVSKFNLSADDIDGANYTMNVFVTPPQCFRMVEDNECIYVPDDNFEAYLEANGMGNGVANDDTVLKANVSGVTTLDVSNQNISDLTGIESFTSLQSLNCSNNLFTSINLSQNILLEILDCGDTPLASLDISTNTALTDLSCKNANLMSLDLSTNILLQSVVLDNNSITDLDLSLQTALTNVFIASNELTSLNVKNGNNINIPDAAFVTSGNTDLICVVVDSTVYSNSTWTNIDTGITTFDENCLGTYIPDDNFEQALINLGYDSGPLNDHLPIGVAETITSLSFTNNNITDLTGLEEMVNLEALICSSNNISNLDVSNNLALTSLRCNNNPLNSLDVSANTALQILKTSNTNITSIDLSNNTLLTQVELENCALTSVDLRNGNNTAIAGNKFNAGNNPDLSCISVSNLAHATDFWTDKDSTTTFSLSCGETYVPDANFEAYLEANAMGNGIADDNYVTTANISGITTLSISSQSISDLTGIESFSSLQSLNCSGNLFTSVDLSDNLLLETLNIENGALNDLDVTKNTALINLFCQANNLTTLNVTQNVNLLELNCSDNSINSLNLTQNTLLENLNFSQNSLTSIDVTQNLNLGYLIADNNNITTLNVVLNTALKELSILDNEVTTLDLSTNVVLEKVNANNNNLGYLNIANGNNVAITEFTATGNTNLTCINIDDDAQDLTSWNKDPEADFSAHCYETYVPDNNFEAYLEANGMGNGIANDDYVTTANIASVTDLDVKSSSISDLTGIEAFTALTSLDVSSNTLVGLLDLTANINLTNIDCEFNSLTSLDITGLTALSTLDYEGNNLTAIDVTTNTALTEIRGDDNTIGSIDLSNNTLLKTLRLDNAGLNSIDLCNNPLIRTIRISNNNLTSIDVSSNPEIFSFHVNNNQLTYLDIKNGNNTNIPPIFFNAQGNPDLECINVDSVAFSNSTWPLINGPTSFGEYCYDTYVPDDNFEQALIDLGYDSGTLDDYVPTNSISGVTFLNVVGQGISDFTGIEDFVAIEILLALNNTMLSIDVSANVNLKQLWCDSSAALTTINISTLTALETLSLSNTPISNVDVSNNTALKTLRMVSTGVTTLDVSNNLLLEFLHINNTPIIDLDLSLNSKLTQFFAQNGVLESLNMKNGNNANVTNFLISGNPNLSCINVDNVAYSTTNWTTNNPAISFSERCGETYVPDDNFENYLETHNTMGEVVAFGNSSSLGNGIANDNYARNTSFISQIPTLDVSNQNIADLTGIEDFVSLQFLDCSNNQLIALDLSSNTELGDLYANNNVITSLNLESNTKLDEIYVQNNNLNTLSLTDGSSDDNLGFNAIGNPNLYCIKVDNAAAFTALRSDFIDPQTSFSDNNCQIVVVAPKVFLQGATLNPNTGEENLMRDDLRVANLIPTAITFHSDDITYDPTVFNTTGDNAIVDWVGVELRSPTNVLQIVDSQPALLQRDGDIVALDGVSYLRFIIAPDNYYVVIKHRNHLGVMTANTMALSSVVTTIDFTDANNQISYGSNAQTTFGMPSGILGMWAGNANNDAIIQSLGINSDNPSILTEVVTNSGNFFGFPTYVINGYNNKDLNMDGQTQALGTNSETPLILQNTLVHPNNFFGFSTYQIIEQLPENFNQ